MNVNPASNASNLEIHPSTSILKRLHLSICAMIYVPIQKMFPVRQRSLPTCKFERFGNNIFLANFSLRWFPSIFVRKFWNDMRVLSDHEYWGKFLVAIPTSSLPSSSSSLDTGVGGWMNCSNVGCALWVWRNGLFVSVLGTTLAVPRYSTCSCGVRLLSFWLKCFNSFTCSFDFATFDRANLPPWPFILCKSSGHTCGRNI